MQIRKALSQKNTDKKGGKTVEEITGKKEFLIYIPNETSHAGHMVEEINLIFLQNTKYRRKKRKKLLPLKKNDEFERIRCYVQNINSYLDLNFLDIFIQYAGILQPIDKHLIQEIHANAGIIRDVHEMRRCLNRVVQSEIFQKGNCPPKSNKRVFFPRLKPIRSHMVEAIKKLRHSKIDQECQAKPA